MDSSQGLSGYVAGGVGSILSGGGHGDDKSKKTKKKPKSSLPLSYLFDGAETRGELLISSTQGRTTEAAAINDRAVGLDHSDRHQVASVEFSAHGATSNNKLNDDASSSSLNARTNVPHTYDSDNELDYLKPKKAHPARRRKSDFQTDPERNRRTVFIGNLPLGFKKKHLLRMCSEFGQISSVRFRSVSVADGTKSRRLAVFKKEFAKDREGQNAYVVYCEEEAAQRALVLHNRVVEERHINVDIAANEGQRDYKRSVFIGNLPHDIQEEVVRDFFAKTCGPVDRVRLIRDPRTGEGKGFGYVWFTERETVLLAVNCHGEELQGRAMRVFRAKNPSSSHSSQSSGGRNTKTTSGLHSAKGQVPKKYNQHSKRSSSFQKKGMKNTSKNKYAKGKQSKRKGKPQHKTQGKSRKGPKSKV